MAMNLLLGPVVLQDFELPERISWGGEQRVAIHRLPGGQRVIDTLGRDDAPITWSGAFSGISAGTRARLLDLLRVQGAVLPLTWDSFFYSVVITKFEADYTRPNWIPYRIACTVLRDEAEYPITLALSGAETILADLAGVGAAIDVSAASAAMSIPGAATIGTAANASASASITAAASSLAAANAGAEAAFITPLTTDPASLSAITDAAGNMASYADATGYLNRAAANLSNATA